MWFLLWNVYKKEVAEKSICIHSVGKLNIMSHFYFWAFSTKFCPIKSYLSVDTV